MNLINFLLCYFVALYPGVCWCTFYHIDLYYNITPRCTICRNFTVKSWLMPSSHERGSSAVRVRMCVWEHPQASVSNTGVPGHQSASQSSPPRSKQTQNICIIFIKRWTNVKDVGLTLNTCYTNVLCLLGFYGFHRRRPGRYGEINF